MSCGNTSSVRRGCGGSRARRGGVGGVGEQCVGGVGRGVAGRGGVGLWGEDRGREPSLPLSLINGFCKPSQNSGQHAPCFQSLRFYVAFTDSMFSFRHQTPAAGPSSSGSPTIARAHVTATQQSFTTEPCGFSVASRDYKRKTTCGG